MCLCLRLLVVAIRQDGRSLRVRAPGPRPASSTRSPLQAPHPAPALAHRAHISECLCGQRRKGGVGAGEQNRVEQEGLEHHLPEHRAARRPHAPAPAAPAARGRPAAGLGVACLRLAPHRKDLAAQGAGRPRQ